MMAESDVIEHLISVEHEAASLMQDAQIEADKRISVAKVQADELYKKQYEQLILELDAQYEKRSAEITQKKDADFRAYQENIERLQTDEASFNTLLDSLLFAQ